MIFAALKWIRSTLCSNAGEQVPQTSMPYVALGTMLRKKMPSLDPNSFISDIIIVLSQAIYYPFSLVVAFINLTDRSLRYKEVYRLHKCFARKHA